MTIIEIAGRGWVLGAKLRPGALVAMGLGSGPELVDAVLPIEQVFGDDGRRVADAVLHEPDRRRGSELIEELSLGTCRSTTRCGPT